MANFVYNYGKQALLQGSFNFGAVTGSAMVLKMLIATNSYVPNIDTHLYRASITSTAGNEVSGSGYTAGGFLLSSPNIQVDNTLNQGILYATSMVLTPITFTSALYGVIYASSGLGVASDPLICALDLGTDPASGNYWAVTAGTFNINTPAAGVLALT